LAEQREQAGNIEITSSPSSSRELRKAGRNLRSFVIDNIANYGNPGVTPLTNVLPQGLLDEVSVNADAPSKIQSIGGEEYGGGFDCVLEGGIWSSTETF